MPERKGERGWEEEEITTKATEKGGGQSCSDEYQILQPSELRVDGENRDGSSPFSINFQQQGKQLYHVETLLCSAALRVVHDSV